MNPGRAGAFWSVFSLVPGFAFVLALASVGAGCAKLPAISSGVCGNAVVEPPEDCDSFAPDANAVCLPRGSAGECHFDCRARPNGTRPSCPAGWGCDVQGICRAPSGGFVPLPETIVGGASSLLAGDFDGDGRADVVSLEARDALDRARPTFHYFDAGGAAVDRHVFPKSVATPMVTDVSGDGRGDFVFSTFSIGLLLGQADRSWVPETFSSYHFQGAEVRTFTVNDTAIQDISGVVVATTIGGVPALYLPDQTGVLRNRANLPGPLDDLLGAPQAGDIVVDAVDSPCKEMVLAARGGSSFQLVSSCVRDLASGALVWREQFQTWTVALDPPAAIDAAPQVTDIDGDGNLDVLIGAGGRPYVALGDGHGLAVATPYRVPLSNPEMISPDIGMPLAAGDFTGDGAVDFVFPDYLLVSMPGAAGAPPIYAIQHETPGAPWTVARIADFNGNGKVDVIAASSQHVGIDFFNGTGTDSVVPSTIATDRPVSLIEVGDFDGDLIRDIAFVEAAASADDRDTLMIAFGAPAGPPTAAVPVARIAHTEQLVDLDEDGVGNLIVASTEGAGDQAGGALTVLDGSSDRLPFAPQQLVSVSPDSSVFTAGGLALAVGALTAPGAGDLLALTSDGRPSLHDFHFWLLPAFGALGPAVPLGGGLDPRLAPASGEGPYVTINAAGVAVDLDGDGRDETAWAMPADGGGACAIIVVDVAAGATQAPPAVSDPIVLAGEPCPSPQLAAVDVDGDGWRDVVLLTGTPGTPGRKLRVLWNDGQGQLSGALITTVNPASDSPEQFTVLAGTPLRPLTFAYVTPGGASLASAPVRSRTFGAPSLVVPLAGGTGIVAADVNGDGLSDLVVAASGNLRVLLSGLTVP